LTYVNKLLSLVLKELLRKAYKSGLMQLFDQARITVTIWKLLRIPQCVCVLLKKLNIEINKESSIPVLRLDWIHQVVRRASAVAVAIRQE